MTTAVIGATGRVGSEIVRGVLARGDAVAALVRDPGKARRAFGEPGGLHIRPTRLDDPRDLNEAFDGVRTVFIAMGSTGVEGVLQRIAINAAAAINGYFDANDLGLKKKQRNFLGVAMPVDETVTMVSTSAAVRPARSSAWPAASQKRSTAPSR